MGGQLSLSSLVTNIYMGSLFVLVDTHLFPKALFLLQNG